MTKLTDLSVRQLKTFEVTQRIKMAWVALWFALGLFAIVLVAFLLAAFYFHNAAPTWLLGAIDLLLGMALNKVYSYLFPSPAKA